jgi:hypothetical protein
MKIFNNRIYKKVQPIQTEYPFYIVYMSQHIYAMAYIVRNSNIYYNKQCMLGVLKCTLLLIVF